VQSIRALILSAMVFFHSFIIKAILNLNEEPFVHYATQSGFGQM